VLAPQPAVAAAEGQAGDAGVGHHAARRDEAECLRLAVDVAQHGAALDVDEPALRVDLDAVHLAEVDLYAAVDRRQAGDRVPAAAHRDRQAPVAREAHGLDDVGRAATSHNDCGGGPDASR
jgi:hypothetical protein